MAQTGRIEMSRIWLDIVCGERRCQDEHGRVCCHWHYNHALHRACMCDLFGPLRTTAQLCDVGTPIRAEQCIRQTIPRTIPIPKYRPDRPGVEAFERVDDLEKRLRGVEVRVVDNDADKDIRRLDNSFIDLRDRVAKAEDSIKNLNEWVRKLDRDNSDRLINEGKVRDD